MDSINKQKILEEIEHRSDNFQKISSIQYKIRCPICGDSQKNLKDAHCYIKCSFNPMEPLLYYCFLCNSHGFVGKKFLEALGCKPEIVNKISVKRFNKISAYKNADINIITGDPILKSGQADYVRYRLGDIPDNIWNDLKIIWDLNCVYPYISDKRVANIMPNNRNSISFLSDDKSTLLTRFFDDDMGRWRKIHIFPNDSKSMYTIKRQYDLFSQDVSDICIAEGIMDIISVYINESMSNNSAYIAVLGSDYISGLDYAIAKGLYGRNTRVHIYIDKGIDIDGLRNNLKKYKWLYHSIEICRNMKYKDMGTTPNKIQVNRRKV